MIFLPIDPNKITVTPFQVHKQYTYDYVTAYNLGMRVYDGTYLDHQYNIGDSSDPLVNQLNSSWGIYNYITHAAVYNTYYNNFNNAPYSVVEEFNLSQHRYLYEQCKVFSIPQKLYGESIKESTFKIIDESLSVVYTLIDDGYGNLIDSGSKNQYDLYISGSDDSIIGYWNFYDIYNNQLNYSYDIYNNIPAEKHDLDLVIADDYIEGDDGMLVPYLKGSIDSYMKIKHSDKFNFDGTYAILFRIRMDLVQVETDSIYSTIITKNGYHSQITASKFRYPFQIELINTGVDQYKIKASVYDGIIESSVTSFSEIGNSYVLVIFGDEIKIYLNGILDATGTNNCNRNHILNNCDIYIGKNGNDTRVYNGTITDLIIFNDDIPNPYEFTNLLINKYFNYQIGNVFYNSGIAVLTSQYYYKYLQIFSGYYASASLSYKNTKTIHEYEVACKIPGNRLNHTMNPSTLENCYDTAYASFITGSEFNPYITTVGLYDDDLNLLAVGKASRAIKKPKNKDITYIVKFDV